MRTTSGFIVGGVLATASLLVANGVGGATSDSGPAGTDGGAASCDELEEFDFNLAVSYSFSTPLYAIADAQGYYADECLDVNIIQGSGGSNQLVQLLGAGTAKFGEGDAVSMIAGQAGGANVTAVGRNTAHNQFALIFDEDSLTDEQKAEDPFDLTNLYGLRYGAVEAGSPDLILTYLMNRDGIDRDEIDRVSVPQPGLAPLVLGQVDFIANTAPQAPLVEYEGKDVHVVTAGDVGLNAYGYVYVANNDYLADHQDQIARFLRATGRAMEYAPDHPEEAVDALCSFAEDLCSGGKRDTLVLQFSQYASDYLGPDGRFLCLDEADWEETKALVEATAIDGSRIDVSQAAFTNELLDGCD